MIWSEKPGLMKGYEHEIKLRDYGPFYLKSYPIPNAYKAEVEKQLQEMVDWGVVSPGTTEYVSPLVMVKKKDNSVRICLDARFLNSRIVQEHITPPNPEQILMNFSDHKCMSLIDLTSSYWQIQIKESDRKYTGFSYNNQTYVFIRLPFGLSTSVASFIRGLKQVLGSDILQFVTAYVDDMLIISEDSDMHLIHLERLFCRLQGAGITVKLKKSKFACSEIEFLGHIIKPNGVSMDPKRIEAIKDFPTPRNPRHLKACLGLCGYGRRFCANLGNLTEPLVPLLRKGHSWSWGPQQLKAFEDVKEAFLKVTMLCHPNPDWPYIIQTDSSDYGIGACLFQRHPSTKEEKVLAFCSRILHGPERNYTITEKELLSVRYALQTWRVMVLGQDLTIITDHKSLTFLKKCKLLSARLTRWILYIQEYDFKIEHCRGVNNETADILSRYPVKGSTGEDFSRSSGSIKTYVTKISAEFKEVRKRLQNIREEQLRDDWCGTIIARVNSDDCPEKIKDLYVVYNQILFRREPKSEWGYLVCVPAKLIESIVLQEHRDNGHFGSEKCFNFLKRFYYWPKMNKRIRQTLAACDLCQKTKISRAIEGKMHHVISERPNDILCLDLMGPLPVSRGGATQLLVTVDAFSKFVKLYPLRRATTKAILNKLQNDYFPNYGTPQKILSDNGTQFRSQTWISVLESIFAPVSTIPKAI
ncbi:hypothetical protein ILUMI_17213 [Ignelater luminosus]|uniref:RNA-directed DNA polymerase n=1 Tax=Ignelater luminosus TaxID=2038154 RepID=A0A8K0G7S0_IGNLU|nr:hypothetical protein ILUMI_17213 [Ignelater luminosus]